MVCKACFTLLSTALALGLHTTAAASCSAAFASCGSDATATPSCCPDNFYCQPWDAGFYQCVKAPDQCKQQLVNTDFYGDDIKTIFGIQPGDCCTECAKTAGCVAYTFVNNNPGSPACYLKKGMSDRRSKTGAVSGIVVSTPAPPAQCSIQLQDTDLYGADIKTVMGIQNSECCDQCSKTTGCVAYTFVAGGNTDQNACYLKKGAGEKRTKTGAISGLLGATTPTPTPSIITTPTPTPSNNTTPTPTPSPSHTPSNGCTTAPYNGCGDSTGTKCCPAGFYCQPWSPASYQCIDIPPLCSVQQTDVDFYGNDIKTVYVSHPKLCCDECAKTTGCKAYTYINGGDGQPVCYLKSAAGTPTRLVGAVAGKLN